MDASALAFNMGEAFQERVARLYEQKAPLEGQVNRSVIHKLQLFFLPNLVLQFIEDLRSFVNRYTSPIFGF